MINRNIKSASGKPACAGYAKGKPVVVHNAADLERVGEGDILIAKETCIAFVSAMHRASAIVTETGGRFCHAAVWARENKKPTILQVDRATEIFSGADTVHVDATAGTVEMEE